MDCDDTGDVPELEDVEVELEDTLDANCDGWQPAAINIEEATKEGAGPFYSKIKKIDFGHRPIDFFFMFFPIHAFSTCYSEM